MEGQKILGEVIFSDQPTALEDPRLLTRFVIHMFADLKKYHYYYWFAFPAIVLPSTIKIQEKIQPIKNVLSESVISNITSSYISWKKDNPKQSGFFWLQKSLNGVFERYLAVTTQFPIKWYFSKEL